MRLGWRREIRGLHAHMPVPSSLSTFYKNIRQMYRYDARYFVIFGISVEAWTTNGLKAGGCQLGVEVQGNESSFEVLSEAIAPINSWKCNDTLQYAATGMVFQNGASSSYNGTLYFKVDDFYFETPFLRLLCSGAELALIPGLQNVEGSYSCFYAVDSAGKVYFARYTYPTYRHLLARLRLPIGAVPQGRLVPLFLNAHDVIFAFENAALLLRDARLVDCFALYPHCWSTARNRFIPAGMSRASAFSLLFPYLAVGYENGLIELYLLQNGTIELLRQPEACFQGRFGRVRYLLQGYNVEGEIELLVLAEPQNIVFRVSILPKAQLKAEIRVTLTGKTAIRLIMPITTTNEARLSAQLSDGRVICIVLYAYFRYFAVCDGFDASLALSQIDSAPSGASGSIARFEQDLCRVRFSEYHNTMLMLYLKRCAYLRVPYYYTLALMKTSSFLRDILQEREITDDALARYSMHKSLREHISAIANRERGFTATQQDEEAFYKFIQKLNKKKCQDDKAYYLTGVFSYQPHSISLPHKIIQKESQPHKISSRDSSFLMKEAAFRMSDSIQGQITRISGKHYENASYEPLKLKEEYRSGKPSVCSGRKLSPIIQVQTRSSRPESGGSDVRATAEGVPENTKTLYASTTNAVSQEIRLYHKRMVSGAQSTAQANINKSQRSDPVSQPLKHVLTEKEPQIAGQMRTTPDELLLDAEKTYQIQGNQKGTRVGGKPIADAKGKQPIYPVSEAKLRQEFLNNGKEIDKLISIKKDGNADFREEIEDLPISKYSFGYEYWDYENSQVFKPQTANLDSQVLYEEDDDAAYYLSGEPSADYTASYSHEQPQFSNDSAPAQQRSQTADFSSSTSKFDLIEESSESDTYFTIETTSVRTAYTQDSGQRTRKIDKPQKISKKQQLSLRNAVSGIRNRESTLRVSDKLMENLVARYAYIEKAAGLDNIDKEAEEALRKQIYGYEEVASIVHKAGSLNERDKTQSQESSIEVTRYQEEDRKMVLRQVEIIKKLRNTCYEPYSDYQFTEMFKDVGKILGGEYMLSATPQIEPTEDSLLSFGYTFLQRLQPALYNIFSDGSFLIFSPYFYPTDYFSRSYYFLDIYEEKHLMPSSMHYFKRLFSEYYRSMIPKHAFGIIERLQRYNLAVCEKDLHIYPVSFIWAYLLYFNARGIRDFYTTRKYHYVNDYVNIPCGSLLQSGYSVASTALSTAAELICFKTRYFNDVVRDFASKRCIDILKAKLNNQHPPEPATLADGLESCVYYRLIFHSRQYHVCESADMFSYRVDERQRELLQPESFLFFASGSVFLDCERVPAFENVDSVEQCIRNSALNSCAIYQQVQSCGVLPYSLLLNMRAAALGQLPALACLPAVLNLQDGGFPMHSLPQTAGVVFQCDSNLFYRALYGVCIEEMKITRNTLYLEHVTTMNSTLSQTDAFFLQQRLRPKVALRKLKFPDNFYLHSFLANTIANPSAVSAQASKLGKGSCGELEKAVKMQNLLLRTLNSDIFVSPAENMELQMDSARKRYSALDNEDCEPSDSIDEDVAPEDNRIEIQAKRLAKIGQRLFELETMLQMSNGTLLDEESDSPFKKASGVRTDQEIMRELMLHTGVVSQQMKDLPEIYRMICDRIRREKTEFEKCHDGGRTDQASALGLRRQAVGAIRNLGLKHLAPLRNRK